jgi:hypothetical protein
MHRFPISVVLGCACFSRYAHGAYLKKHTVGHCLKLAQQFMGEAEKLLGKKRVRHWQPASSCAKASPSGFAGHTLVHPGVATVVWRQLLTPNLMS